MNFYQDGKDNIARKADAGFNAKAFKAKDSMKPVRENASEFGYCVRKKYIYARFAALFVKIEGAACKMLCPVCLYKSRTLTLFPKGVRVGLLPS